MRQTDIAIIGGGLAGSTAAAMLGRAGVSAILIEPHRLHPPERDRNVDLQPSDDLRAMRRQYRFGIGKVPQHADARLVERRADVGQRQAARGTFEQPAAEPRLEPPQPDALGLEPCRRLGCDELILARTQGLVHAAARLTDQLAERGLVFGSDVAQGDRWIVAPLVVHAWRGYDVRFPAHERTIDATYYSIESSKLDRQVRRTLPAEALMLGRKVSGASATAVVLADGDRIEATGVIDARGPGDLSLLDLAWQKFLGRELALSVQHESPRPMVMDATIPQIGYLITAFAVAMAAGGPFLTVAVMKFPSPVQRGTAWTCRCSLTLPPAGRPRLTPMFNPSGA